MHGRSERYDAARKSLARAKRQLRHARRRANRGRLKKLVAKRSKTVARDRRAARAACGAGVPAVKRRPLLAMATVVAALAISGLASAAPASAALPPIGHVFVIVLENESASTTFGPGSPAPYLSTTLRSEGAYLPNYYAVGPRATTTTSR